MHHSFLEYYTALGFIEEGSGIRAVAPFALRTRWHEIVTLMFGILSEHTDITEGIRILCEDQSVSDSITATRLELAFDCAMECDVPPEATQTLLGEQLHRVISNGAGLLVGEVRVDLATKICTLLETTGSRAIKGTLLAGLSSEDPEIAAAYVHLVSKLGKYSNEDFELISRLTSLFQLNEKGLQLYLVNALKDLPSLRTEQNLDVVRQILERGSIVEKSAALQLLEEVPSLLNEFSNQVSNILYSDKNLLSLTAASCILRGGFPAASKFIGRGLIDTALEIVTQSDGPRKSLVGRLRIPRQQLGGVGVF